MKNIHTLLIALALTALNMFPGQSRSSQIASESGITRILETNAAYKMSTVRDGELTYVRILIADKWYLFIFEGTELVDVVPE